MAMTVKKRKDTQADKVIIHRIADIPGGVSVKYDSLSDEIKNKGYIPEGTPIYVNNGVAEGAAPTEVTIDVVNFYIDHNFLTGDIYVLTEDAFTNATLPNYAGEQFTAKYGGSLKMEGYVKETGEIMISRVDGFGHANSTADIGNLNLDPNLVMTFKPRLNAITGTGVAVKEGDNIVVDAWVCAVVKAGTANDEWYGAMKGIIAI